MARLAVEALASLSTTSTVDLSGYNPENWSGGDLIRQRTDFSPPFIGPIVTTVGRPVETSAGIPGIHPHVISWSGDIDWVFLADNAGAAATRRVQAYTFTKSTGSLAWLGFVTCTLPTATNHTVRAQRMTYDLFTGTAGVSGGITVVGSGTTWSDDRIPSGCRIGFGSTTPSLVNPANWFEIASLPTNNTLLLSTSSLNISAGTPFVIEDLRCVMINQNATAANGGVFVIKGLNINIFTSAGTTIPAAGTIDNRRASYWLADAAVVTNTNACGAGLSAKTDPLSQNLWVIDSPVAANYRVFQYNIRKALTLAAGKDTTTLVKQTGNNAVTGTVSTTNNGRYGTLNHGPTSGVPCLYFVTTTRIYAAPVAGITAGSTTWAQYAMTEVPPGGVSTFAATGALACVEISSSLDRLVIMSSGTAGVRSYVTKFNTAGDQMDHIFLVDDKQIDQSTADAGTVVHPTILAVLQTTWVEGGVLYVAGVGTTAATNLLHVTALGADWQYASSTKQRLISPEIHTPNCNNFGRMFTIRDGNIGSINLGKSADPFRTYYRTSGITDNSGAWSLVPDGNDMSGVAGTPSIQFMYEFKCISDTCVPGRIYSVGVTYDDLTTLSNYQPSVGQSSTTNKQFAWRFAVAFGTVVPTLKVRLYDADLGTLLLTDDTATPTGTWEKSTNNGGAWASYDTADKTNEDTYIRYTPASFADNIKVRALLTLDV